MSTNKTRRKIVKAVKKEIFDAINNHKLRTIILYNDVGIQAGDNLIFHEDHNKYAYWAGRVEYVTHANLKEGFACIQFEADFHCTYDGH